MWRAFFFFLLLLLLPNHRGSYIPPLGAVAMPAFIRLGHEYKVPLSPCDEMHVCTD